jgi:DNA topoisomerase I
MYLVLVESPTKTKTLEKFLGKDYKVLASGGHVRDLPKSKLGVDVENDFEPQYVIPTRARKNIKLLKEAAKKADIVYLSTDPDREGEAISFHLAFILDLKDYKRVSFNEITKSAVEEAIKNPRKIDVDLVNAQQARRVLDRVVGYKLSPFLWKKVARGLSAGRVQSVALKIVSDREEEIEKFNAEEYWSVDAVLDAEKGSLTAGIKEVGGKKIARLDIKNEKQAREIEEDLKNASFVVSSVNKKEKKRNPSPPFTTSTMQQEAFKRLRFPSRFTMSVAQSLYEKGLITYHRTDSVHLSSQAVTAGKKYITETFGKDYYKGISFKSKGKTQEAHEAVRPAYPEKTVENIKKLKEEERKLYDLIWRRFTASLMSEAVFYSTTVDIDAKNKDKYLLSSSGSVLKHDGFTKVYPVKFQENELPEVKEKEKLSLKEILTEQHFTKPPARFTEATLIKELEKNGIGRPSTYAPTLSTLFYRNYLEKIEKRNLKPTEIGKIVNDLLSKHFPFVVDRKFTSEMEKGLDEVAEGKKEWKKIIANFYKDFAKQLEVKEKELKKEDIMQEEKTNEKCEKCGGEMVIKMGRYGKFMACKNFPDCKNSKPLITEEEKEKESEEEVICDKCQGKMKIKQSRFGKFYGCENYPECKNIKSIKDDDIDMKCPECGEGDVVKRRAKKGNIFYGCSRYPDCKFISNKNPKQEK